MMGELTHEEGIKYQGGGLSSDWRFFVAFSHVLAEVDKKGGSLKAFVLICEEEYINFAEDKAK